MDQGGEATPRLVGRRRAGVAALLGLVLGSFAIAVSGLGEGLEPVRAEDGPGSREVVMHLTFPGARDAGTLTITLLLIDDGVDLSARVAEGRAAMLGRFPGAVEVNGSQVQAQFDISDNVRWPSPGANWSYNSAGASSALTAETALAAIAFGANGWTNAGGTGWKYTYGGESTTAPGCNGEIGALPRDSQNVIGWGHLVNGFWGYTCWWSSDQKVAGTSFLALQEFDIIFESSPSVPYTPNVLKALALHEFGHALGLQHTEAARCPGHVMCGGSGATSLQALTPDDIAGVVALYGLAPTPTPTTKPTATPTATPSFFPGGPKDRSFVVGVARD